MKLNITVPNNVFAKDAVPGCLYKGKDDYSTFLRVDSYKNKEDLTQDGYTMFVNLSDKPYVCYLRDDRPLTDLGEAVISNS